MFTMTLTIVCFGGGYYAGYRYHDTVVNFLNKFKQ